MSGAAANARARACVCVVVCVRDGDVRDHSLSKELRSKHKVRSMPVRKGDEVRIVRGTFANREGKIKASYRKKWVIHIEKITREKANGELALFSLCACGR